MRNERQPISPAHISGAAATIEARKREGEVSISHHMGRKATVACIAGEERPVAEILSVGRTIRTATAGVPQPGNVDAYAGSRPRDAATKRIDDPDDLVAGNDRQLRIGQFAVDDAQIGPADRAGLDAHTNFTGAGMPVRLFLKHQRLPDCMQDHHLHGRSPSYGALPPVPRIHQPV